MSRGFLTTPLTAILEESALTTAPSVSLWGNRFIIITSLAFGGLISLGIIAICAFAIVVKYKSHKSPRGNTPPHRRIRAHNSLETHTPEFSNYDTERFKSTSMIEAPPNNSGQPLRKAKEGPSGIPNIHQGGHRIDRRILHKNPQRQGTITFQEGTQSMTSRTRRVKYNRTRSSPPPSTTNRQKVDPPRRPRDWDLSESSPPQSAQSSTYPSSTYPSSTYPSSVLPEYYARSPSPPSYSNLSRNGTSTWEEASTPNQP